MFLATGISTKNFVHQANPSGVSCDNALFEEVTKICNEWEPIEIVSWISAGLGEFSIRQPPSPLLLDAEPYVVHAVFLYSITLLGIAVAKSYGGNSMWGTSVKNSEI